MIILAFGEQFDLVMADPPYLDENCLTKTSVSIKYLSKKDNTKVVLCTGAVMEDLARRFAHFHGNIPQFIHGFLVRQRQVDEIKTNFNILILLSSSSIDKFFEVDIIFENTIDIDFFSNMHTFEI